MFPNLPNQSLDHRVHGGLEEAITINPAELGKSSSFFKSLFHGTIPKLYATQALVTHEGYIANAHRFSL